MSNRFFLLLLLLLVVNLPISALSADGERVYVYKDYNALENQGVWGSIMPARAAEISSALFKTFQTPGWEGKGTAVQILFDLTQPPNWAGIVVPVHENYWGEWRASALDLSKAKKLVFYARGEAGGEQIQVKAAIATDKPYGDSALIPITSAWLPLEKDWKRFEIPVDGSQLQRVITPFSIMANKAHNPPARITLYVDEIYYELAE
ncbi:exported hypothetical protein [Gammaproteobacteria bacterium]